MARLIDLISLRKWRRLQQWRSPERRGDMHWVRGGGHHADRTDKARHRRRGRAAQS